MKFKNHRVLLRCYGDEPALMFATYCDEKTVLVSRRNPPALHTNICWWRDYLFHPDEELFAELKEAFNRFDKDSLQLLWRKARRYYIDPPPEPPKSGFRENET